MDPGTTALCLVRAQDRTVAEVGSALVRVGPSRDRTLRVSFVLPTTARAVIGDVTRCEVAGPGQEPDAPVASLAAGRADRSAQ